MTLQTPGGLLLLAQQTGLSHDERVDTLNLTPLNRSIAALDVAGALTGAHVTLTIDGPSVVTLDIEDPTWAIERSGILDTNSDGRMDAIAMHVDQLAFRLSAARRDTPEILTLEFEDLAKALLDEHTKHIAASRNTVTRAQFIGRMVAEVKARKLVYWAPSSVVKQPVARPDLPAVKPAHGDTGFDVGAKLKIGGVEADAQQMREVATALGVADQEGASERVRLALLVAGIGESGFRAIPNSRGSGYEGVFQANPVNIPRTDTEQQARYFLKGGKGFQQGGAIKLARANPTMSPGTIATKVEASGQPGSFYDDYLAEAKKILSQYNGGGNTTTSGVIRYKQFRFTRGLPGQKETSWQAGLRLAQEVNWRLYTLGGVVVFISDDDLLTQPAALILDGADANGDWTLPTGLLSMPSYDWNHGKLAGTVTLRASANAWSVAPGSVVALRNMGPATGRWIVETFEFDLFNATQATVTLIKPLPPRDEPAPEFTTVDKSGSATGTADGGTPPTIAKGAMLPGTHLNAPITQFLSQIGGKLGKALVVTTGTNHAHLTITGNVSDHAAGNAADMGTAANGIAFCDQICFEALKLCGIDDTQAQKYATNGIGQDGVSLQWHGHKVQVFWKSDDPGIGDHYDHVHCGVQPS